MSHTIPALLAAFCRQYGVAKLWLFGSVLREDFHAHRSDVDVLVESQPGVRRSLFKLVEMQSALSEMFGRQMDLNTPGSLSKYFRNQVLASAEWSMMQHDPLVRLRSTDEDRLRSLLFGNSPGIHAGVTSQEPNVSRGCCRVDAAAVPTREKRFGQADPA